MPDKTPLQLAKEALDTVIAQKKQNQELIKSLGPAIIDTLKPILNEIASNSRIPKDELLRAISNIKIPDIKIPEPNITINAPDLPKFPKIPEPKVTVNFDYSKIKIPEIKMPEEMDIRGWVQLQGVNLQNPLPVQLRDASGKPVNLLENLTTIIGGSSGGGKRDYLTVKGFGNSAYADYLNADNRLKVSTETGSLTDAELRASAVPVIQVSGASWSVEASQGDGWAVSQVSGSVNSVVVNDVLVTVGVNQVSGANWSVTASATDLDIRDLVNATDSVSAYQVSGANYSVEVATQPITFDVKQVSGAINSVNVQQLNGTNISVNDGDSDAGTQRIYVAHSASGTTAAVSIGADTSTSIVPTNIGRKSVAIVHASAFNLYISTGTANSTTSLPIVGNQIIGFDDYTGPINAIAEEASGTISVRYLEISK